MVVAMGLAALAATCGCASDGPIERATLRGLKAVRVIVDPPDQDLQKAGITAAKLTEMIEQRMKQMGMQVDSQAVEFVGLRVTAAHEKKKNSAVCLTLALYQNVTLARDPKIKATTETWSGDSVVLAPPQLFFEAVSNTVNQLVDQFANAFRTANPAEK
jgi:hypothetical protein